MSDDSDQRVDANPGTAFFASRLKERSTGESRGSSRWPFGFRRLTFNPRCRCWPCPITCAIIFAMFEATVDKATNLLTGSYSGHIAPEEAKVCAEKIQLLLSSLQPGFRMLTDLRALELMDLGCVTSIEKVMDWCDDAGIGMVVRIIPNPQKDIGLNIMSLF